MKTVRMVFRHDKLLERFPEHDCYWYKGVIDGTIVNFIHFPESEWINTNGGGGIL